MAGMRLESAAYLPVLQPMSFALELGQVVGVIGPNGAGKSTLLRLMVSLIAPTSGQVVVADMPITRQPPRWRAQQIAYLPQLISDDIPFTVREFVEMGRYSRESAWAQGTSRRDAVMAAVAQMGLDRLLDAPLAQISGENASVRALPVAWHKLLPFFCSMSQSPISTCFTKWISYRGCATSPRLGGSSSSRFITWSLRCAIAILVSSLIREPLRHQAHWIKCFTRN
ncbi:ATP-binding cassette domain-containing protein [Alicyclobacillus sacchari]|uniref:ATP-binding cassette domain-containing protein n=1 Tax=Alicyclobacillus sacchari TaxID=392010 RepID=UPI0024E153A9|nr:ABC transporter ATP-binding protein [Alicyclobacillus sacchari]